jgi:NTP pyrophosphatase (non-canonical NTP hydrolase)
LPGQRELSVTICGSFRREPALLRSEFDALVGIGCRVVSPLDITFVAEEDGFVMAEHEVEDLPWTIEQKHLSAILESDFVWFHGPQGYIGRSGALEIGFAHAHGVPIFGTRQPTEVGFRDMVHLVADPAEVFNALEGFRTAPSSSVPRLQQYYKRIASERGYDHESLQDSMLLLTEEVGELARAIRKHVGLIREGGYANGENAGEELADIQLYVVHLANLLGIDLADAIRDKESENRRRFEERTRRLSA